MYILLTDLFLKFVEEFFGIVNVNLVSIFKLIKGVSLV